MKNEIQDVSDFVLCVKAVVKMWVSVIPQFIHLAIFKKHCILLFVEEGRNCSLHGLLPLDEA